MSDVLPTIQSETAKRVAIQTKHEHAMDPHARMDLMQREFAEALETQYGVVNDLVAEANNRTEAMMNGVKADYSKQMEKVRELNARIGRVEQAAKASAVGDLATVMALIPESCHGEFWQGVHKVAAEVNLAATTRDAQQVLYAASDVLAKQLRKPGEAAAYLHVTKRKLMWSGAGVAVASAAATGGTMYMINRKSRAKQETKASGEISRLTKDLGAVEQEFSAYKAREGLSHTAQA